MSSSTTRRTDGHLRLRRRDHRLRVRRQRCRAACRGEGLPRRRHGSRQALERRGHSEDQLGPEGLLVVPRGGAVRDSKARVPRRCARPLWRRRRRRLACLRQHAVCPAEAVLRRTGMGRHHRLGRRAGALLRPGKADARRRSLSLHADRRRSVHAAGRDRNGQGRNRSTRLRSASTSGARASKPRIPTSAEWGRGAPGASHAATARSAAATTPRTR